MDDRKRIGVLPGVVTQEGEGPAPQMVDDLDRKGTHDGGSSHTLKSTALLPSLPNTA